MNHQETSNIKGIAAGKQLCRLNESLADSRKTNLICFNS